MTPETLKSYTSIWSARNDAGRGYAVGSEGQTPEQACESEGWEILHRRANDREICVARNHDGSLFGVGDANGPWAVDLIGECVIKELLDEAATAGDEAQVAICQRALEGDSGAIEECARVIALKGQ